MGGSLGLTVLTRLRTRATGAELGPGGRSHESLAALAGADRAAGVLLPVLTALALLALLALLAMLAMLAMLTRAATRPGIAGRPAGELTRDGLVVGVAAAALTR